MLARLFKRDPFKRGEERLAVFTTAHAAESDTKILQACAKNNGDAPLVVYEHGEYGWLINTAPGNLEPEQLERDGISQDLQRLILDMSAAGYAWLLLDKDAPAHPDYPTHDW